MKLQSVKFTITIITKVSLAKPLDTKKNKNVTSGYTSWLQRKTRNSCWYINEASKR